MKINQKNNAGVNEDIRVDEKHSCLLCESEGLALYQGLRDRLFSAPGTWTLLRCPKCGLVWLNPQPIAEDMVKLYTEYFTHDVLPKTLKKKPTKSWRKTIKLSILNSAFGYKSDNANKTLGWLTSRIGLLRDIAGGEVMWLNGSHPGKLLDVGCGNGQFLAAMQGLGWEVTGVEPDVQAVKVAREQYGLNIYEGVLEEVAFPDNTFDAITMSHVVEHLIDPVSIFRECRRILKKTGRLVVTVPNIGSLGHRLYKEACLHLDPPRHIFNFSPSTLRSCVERTGLQVLELRTTARLASGILLTSRLLRRDGILPGGTPRKQSFGLLILGLAFQAVEQGLCLMMDVGEEIVLIAEK